MRLIDADEAYKVLTDYYHHKTEIQHNALKEAIERVPTVDPVKHGHWIDAYPDIEPNPMFMYGICSVCGCEQAISNKLNFCPDCGADMRGEQDG